MKKLLVAVVVTSSLIAAAMAAAQTVGQPAPSFSVADITGKAVTLSDFKGKYLVLEWTNPGCPFVQKHYNSGNMPALQKSSTAQGVVWLAVSSTAKGMS